MRSAACASAVTPTALVRLPPVAASCPLTAGTSLLGCFVVCRRSMAPAISASANAGPSWSLSCCQTEAVLSHGHSSVSSKHAVEHCER